MELLAKTLLARSREVRNNQIDAEKTWAKVVWDTKVIRKIYEAVESGDTSVCIRQSSLLNTVVLDCISTVSCAFTNRIRLDCLRELAVSLGFDWLAYNGDIEIKWEDNGKR